MNPLEKLQWLSFIIHHYISAQEVDLLDMAKKLKIRLNLDLGIFLFFIGNKK